MQNQKEDHTQRVRLNPEAYGFTSDEIQALTDDELKRGVTREYMRAYGEWLSARAKRARLKSLAKQGWHPQRPSRDAV
ncbi:MAG: hypothetical protein CMM52_09735 [Rhodospirillaceae bacterium]|nr:hypothetical protein [Rhodospirillaceae bacterium]|tara:strand:+ start:15501 stop:15734 length:234 start_codon:yes stop_codon:yes gene_type:complete